MYQWRDPETGTTQLSGKPPSWYRTDEKGPRVIVFDNGKIIDDTAISLGRSQREELRRQAILRAEEDIESARTRAVEAETIKSAKGNATQGLNKEGDGPPVGEAAVPQEKEDIKKQQEKSLETLSREEMLEIINKLDNMLESPEQSGVQEDIKMPAQ